MKILIDATTYSIGKHMGGIGVRLWELSQVLSKRYEIVFLVTEIPSLEFKQSNISFQIYKEKEWKEIIDACDVLFTSDIPNAQLLIYAHEHNKLIISENATPIEHLEYHSVRNHTDPNENYQEIINAFKLQVLLTDHFITRATVENATLLSSLALLGRINYFNYGSNENLSNLITHIPIGFNQFSDAYAKEVKPSEKTIDFLWNGGIWEYYKPSTVARALYHLSKRGYNVNTTFMYNPPMDQFIKEKDILVDVSKELNVYDHINFIEQSIPHNQRDCILKSARALVLYGKDTIENYTCNRLRLRDVYLYNIPVIVDDFGATGDLVKQLGIGLAVKDDKELADAMYRIKYDEKLYSELTGNIKRIRHDFLIENNSNNLFKFLESKTKARDSQYLYRNQLLKDLIQNTKILTNKSKVLTG